MVALTTPIPSRRPGPTALVVTPKRAPSRRGPATGARHDRHHWEGAVDVDDGAALTVIDPVARPISMCRAHTHRIADRSAKSVVPRAGGGEPETFAHTDGRRPPTVSPQGSVFLGGT